MGGCLYRGEPGINTYKGCPCSPVSTLSTYLRGLDPKTSIQHPQPRHRHHEHHALFMCHWRKFIACRYPRDLSLPVSFWIAHLHSKKSKKNEQSNLNPKKYIKMACATTLRRITRRKLKHSGGQHCDVRCDEVKQGQINREHIGPSRLLCYRLESTSDPLPHLGTSF